MTIYKFVSNEHERAYYNVMAALSAVDASQQQEYNRVSVEWDSLSIDEQRRKYEQLWANFHECRKPYEKVLADILSLAMPVMFVELERGIARYCPKTRRFEWTVPVDQEEGRH